MSVSWLWHCYKLSPLGEAEGRDRSWPGCSYLDSVHVSWSLYFIFSLVFLTVLHKWLVWIVVATSRAEVLCHYVFEVCLCCCSVLTVVYGVPSPHFTKCSTDKHPDCLQLATATIGTTKKYSTEMFLHKLWELGAPYIQEEIAGPWSICIYFN